MSEPIINIPLTALELISLHEFIYAALCYKGDGGDKDLTEAYEKIMRARDVPFSDYDLPALNQGGDSNER